MTYRKVATLRSNAERLTRIARLVGPHPIALAQTFMFLASRGRRRRKLRRLYASPLPTARVDLRLPQIAIPQMRDLPTPLRPAAALLREQAEHLLAHRVDLLGSGLVELGPEIDWHRDFKSGYRWPVRFYKDVEVTRLDDPSDAKVPWELSRSHHLVTLARATRLFEEERYATELERQLRAWLEQNPPGMGINWTNPMEVSIRAVNLVWAVATLEGERELEPGLRAELIASLRWHAHHIEANLEGTPYLRSNHYVGDLLGLLTLGCVLRGDPAASRWSEFAHSEFEREIGRQVHADGVSFEASVSYHGLVLEMLLIARRVAEWAGMPFSGEFDGRLRRMIQVSATIRHPNGRVPLFGDQDSGRILPEGFGRPPTHDNLLWLSAAQLGERSMIEGLPHPEVAWTFGIEAWRHAAGLGVPPSPLSAAFPDGGLYVLHARRVHVVVRCGDVGQNGSGGHSHNDALSYELSIDGVPLVVDSGTYAYTFDVDARNAHRSTRAHNALVVDGAEINPIEPTRVFELRRFARPVVEAFDLSGDLLELTGSHDGYRRLHTPVVHRRRFALGAANGELLIDDEVVGGGTHTLESFVHFAPGTVLRRVGDTAYEARRGDVYATISFASIESGELIVSEGWVSDRYGIRSRAPVLMVGARRECPVSLGYAIVPARSRRNSPKTDEAFDATARAQFLKRS